MLPADADQLTAVLAALATVATNWTALPAVTDIWAGLTEIATGGEPAVDASRTAPCFGPRVTDVTTVPSTRLYVPGSVTVTVEPAGSFSSTMPPLKSRRITPF